MSGPGDIKPPLYQQPHTNSNPYLQHRGLPPYAPVEGPSPPRQPTPPGYSYNPQPQLDAGYGIEHANGHGNTGEMSQGMSAPAPPGSAAEQAAKAVRLRKACDSCSIRKVKCDETQRPCRACAALDIPCTFDRPSRRRGPTNKHAEAVKKRKVGSDGTPGSYDSPTSPNNVAATLASFSSHAVLNAESICPFSTLELLVDDFFTYIHPLCPFPHEPSFRSAFAHREDLTNPPFLALLASMVGVLVASFPRKPRLHLKAQHREHLFPSSMSLVERCHKVAVEARGAGYLDKELSVYDAVTSYFLGLAGAYSFQWKQTRLYFGECWTIVRTLGAHKLKNPGSLNLGSLPAMYGSEVVPENDVQPIDYIKQEIGRRVFWVLFVGIRSMQQLGASSGELIIPPPTATEPYPPLPMEIDDEYLFADQYHPQPSGTISELTGFNFNVKVYLAITPLATLELAYGIDEIFDWNRQKKVLESCLSEVKKALDVAPRELLLQNGFQVVGENPAGQQYYPPMHDHPGLRFNGTEAARWYPTSPEARRQLQYEIQKANIYASQLGTRSYIVEKYWGLYDAYQKSRPSSSGHSKSPKVLETGLDGMLPKITPEDSYETVEANVATERENIVKDLLMVLGTISQVNMEPNGGSFINKIRQIASTLIENPPDRKGPVAMKTEEYLGRFLEVLMKLERVSVGQHDGSAAVDEEEELRNWADLRDYQLRFAQAGGFMNEIG